MKTNIKIDGKKRVFYCLNCDAEIKFLFLPYRTKIECPKCKTIWTFPPSPYCDLTNYELNREVEP